jgi:hypothetical protein
VAPYSPTDFTDVLEELPAYIFKDEEESKEAADALSSDSSPFNSV